MLFFLCLNDYRLLFQTHAGLRLVLTYPVSEIIIHSASLVYKTREKTTGTFTCPADVNLQVRQKTMQA